MNDSADEEERHLVEIVQRDGRAGELIAGLERQNRVHPSHNVSLFEGLTHYVLPLKECVVEVVARNLSVHRVEGTTAEAAVRARG